MMRQDGGAAFLRGFSDQTRPLSALR